MTHLRALFYSGRIFSLFHEYGDGKDLTGRFGKSAEIVNAAAIQLVVRSLIRVHVLYAVRSVLEYRAVVNVRHSVRAVYVNSIS